MKINRMKITFLSLTENEAFARNVVAGFCLSLNPTIDEIIEIKTAVSEAVTNAIVHAYSDTTGEITIGAEIIGDTLYISVSDNGVGIADIDKAVQPFYTSKPDDERTGMGFTVMESFMDRVEVKNNSGGGISVYMQKKIGNNAVEIVA